MTSSLRDRVLDLLKDDNGLSLAQVMRRLDVKDSEPELKPTLDAMVASGELELRKFKEGKGQLPRYWLGKTLQERIVAKVAAGADNYNDLAEALAMDKFALKPAVRQLIKDCRLRWRAGAFGRLEVVVIDTSIDTSTDEGVDEEAGPCMDLKDGVCTYGRCEMYGKPCQRNGVAVGCTPEIRNPESKKDLTEWRNEVRTVPVYNTEGVEIGMVTPGLAAQLQQVQAPKHALSCGAPEPEPAVIVTKPFYAKLYLGTLDRKGFYQHMNLPSRPDIGVVIEVKDHNQPAVPGTMLKFKVVDIKGHESNLKVLGERTLQEKPKPNACIICGKPVVMGSSDPDKDGIGCCGPSYNEYLVHDKCDRENPARAYNLGIMRTPPENRVPNVYYCPYCGMMVSDDRLSLARHVVDRHPTTNGIPPVEKDWRLYHYCPFCCMTVDSDHMRDHILSMHPGEMQAFAEKFNQQGITYHLGYFCNLVAGKGFSIDMVTAQDAEAAKPVCDRPSGPCRTCAHGAEYPADKDGTERRKCTNQAATGKNRVIRGIDQVRTEGCHSSIDNAAQEVTYLSRTRSFMEELRSMTMPRRYQGVCKHCGKPIDYREGYVPWDSGYYHQQCFADAGLVEERDRRNLVEIEKHRAEMVKAPVQTTQADLSRWIKGLPRRALA